MKSFLLLTTSSELHDSTAGVTARWQQHLRAEVPLLIPRKPLRQPLLVGSEREAGICLGLQWATRAEAGSWGSRGDVGEGSSPREEPTVLGPPDLAGNRLLLPSAF